MPIFDVVVVVVIVVTVVVVVVVVIPRFLPIPRKGFCGYDDRETDRDVSRGKAFPRSQLHFHQRLGTRIYGFPQRVTNFEAPNIQRLCRYTAHASICIAC